MATSLPPPDTRSPAQPPQAPPDRLAAPDARLAPEPPHSNDTPFVEEGRLQRAIAAYLPPDEGEYLVRVLDYAHTLRAAAAAATPARDAAGDAGEPSSPSPARPHAARTHWDFAYAILVAQVLAESVHVDAESLAAVLLYQAVELGLATPDEIGAALGGALGAGTAGLIQSIERFDALQRPAAARRRAAGRAADGAAHPGERDTPTRERRRERQRKEEDEAVRKMFIGLAEDPRVVIFKIADQLITMRAVRETADLLRQRAGTPISHSTLVRDEPGSEPPVEDAATPAHASPPEAARDGSEPARDGSANAASEVEPEVEPEAAPRWTLEECLVVARETRTLYAPLAGRLGLGRLESELEDLAFAVLEPEEYRWLSEAVADEKHQRASYVARVCDILREELAKIGLRAEVSGRVKHLYSIYKKVQRTGSHDISQLYDIIAFRIITESVSDCYVALGHVHQLWRPKDGRIKDFIATPKPNGYRSLHTTVFCLDERLAEIQIRTRDQHQVAEYGMAMHWHYKEVGDSASAAASDLQGWVKQVLEWQQELRHGPADAAAAPLLLDGRDLPGEQIYVFTPAGDPKELPALSTPLDFAYRIHSNIGDHTAGARVTTDEGRLVTRMVPLDYELHNGDTVEIITHKNAHPTRDWLRFARTKAARTHIQRYVKAHERQIDQQIGRERLDRELKLQGIRAGLEDLREDDLLWAARALKQEGVEDLLVALGTEKLRPTAVIAALRERLPDRFAPPPDAHDTPPSAAEPPRAPEPAPPGGVDVAGVAGLFTRLASCCNPVPGDEVRGFITRGRGVVVHRADCPNLAALLRREPERAVKVELSHLDGQQTYRVPIVVQATDRPGLLADVTGVISRLKINMAKVTTMTNPVHHTATITAVLELSQADQLESVFAHILGVKSVHEVERKQAKQPKSADKSGATGGANGKRSGKGAPRGRR